MVKKNTQNKWTKTFIQTFVDDFYSTYFSTNSIFALHICLSSLTYFQYQYCNSQDERTMREKNANAYIGFVI